MTSFVRRADYQGPTFWKSERVNPVAVAGFLVVNAILQALDAGTTWIGMQLGGSEANPLMAPLFSQGPALFFFVKAMVILSLVAWAVIIAYRREATQGMVYGTVGLAVAFVAIVATNLALIMRHVYF